ncbi:MAG TPA: hypothetical protein VIW73_13520 [Candidatus Cybelea sp.]
MGDVIQLDAYREEQPSPADLIKQILDSSEFVLSEIAKAEGVSVEEVKAGTSWARLARLVNYGDAAE